MSNFYLNTNNNLNDDEVMDIQIQNMSNFEKGTMVVFSITVLVKSIVLFLIGAFIFLILIISVFHSYNYIQTTATIVDSEFVVSENLYYPIYEFEYKGKLVRGKGFPESELSDIVIGEKEVIQYDPDNYEKFDIGSSDGDMYILFIALFFLIIAISQFVSIVKMLRALVRDKKSRNSVSI